MQRTRKTEILTADKTLVETDSGKVFVLDAVDLEITLPATKAGLYFDFVVATPSATTGAQLSPVAADSINGGTDDKDLINTAATDAKGDAVRLVADGVDGWFTQSKVGTWAAEA